MMDITSILKDKDWHQKLQIVRKTFQLRDGINELMAGEPFTISCVIVPSISTGRFILPEADMISGRLVIFTRHQLVGLAKGEMPGATGDYFDWHGNSYQITDVKPWSDYHYYMAYADIITPSGVDIDEF